MNYLAIFVILHPQKKMLNWTIDGQMHEHWHKSTEYEFFVGSQKPCTVHIIQANFINSHHIRTIFL